MDHTKFIRNRTTFKTALKLNLLESLIENNPVEGAAPPLAPLSQVVGPVLIRCASISPPSYLMILLNHIRFLLVPARGSPFSAPFPSPPRYAAHHRPSS